MTRLYKNQKNLLINAWWIYNAFLELKKKKKHLCEGTPLLNNTPL